ncbi:hypothetical protein E2C01_011731 [Portunus trituberculatus]|uniref:Uncharacterized protein n=1 Tax=Portunus trituberculatus TaxID=210409 RepID=A0A5B7DCA1_PORTR|nr:hypothetical protein [Portunus trituberculatus]
MAAAVVSTAHTPGDEVWCRARRYTTTTTTTTTVPEIAKCFIMTPYGIASDPLLPPLTPSSSLVLTY